MADTANFALRCDNLHRYLGQDDARVHVLKGVSFEARRGQVYAIVGPSGCGKSTLLYLLGLLDQPDGGEIEINGRKMSNTDDLARTAARGEHIGFVFQFHFLMLEFTALENVMMPMRKLGRLSLPEMTDRAHILLRSLDFCLLKTHASLCWYQSTNQIQHLVIASAALLRRQYLQTSLRF
jgi:lipoprotein-releasing system ATP-binding protein